MSAGWNLTQVTSGAVHTSENNEANSNENELNQVTPGGAPANHFSLPASLNMHHFQVSRQVTMGAGPSSSLVTPSNGVFGTMEAGSPGNLAAQHSQVTHGISGTMGLSPNLLGQHSQVTRGASGQLEQHHLQI